MPGSSPGPATSALSETRGGVLATLGWACYLACSWTWCIGMFLPVLLVRDYGIWGFVVFAVPNVVGAAAMGWVLCDRSWSTTLREQHRAAMGVFSLTTIAFQLFFFGFLGSAETPLWFATAQLAGIGIVVLTLIWPARSSVLRVTALAVTAFSALAFFAHVRREGIALPEVAPNGDIIWLLPICAFGFLLCPYLDRTFHRVRGETGRAQARIAFIAGFGLVFSAMILFTLSYTPWMLVFARSSGSERLLDDLQTLVLAHIEVQLFFTIGVHAAETATRSRVRAVGLLAGAAALAMIVPSLSGLVGGADVPTREIAYRLFMGFYGLVFPAYVWLCMIPTREGYSGIDGRVGRRKLLVWALAVAIATPAFWMGFIEREEWWLGPGLGVVLLARLLIPGGAGFGRLPREPSGAPVPAPSRPQTFVAHARPAPDQGSG